MSREWTPSLLQALFTSPLLMCASTSMQNDVSVRSWPLQSGNCEPAVQTPPQNQPTKHVRKAHRHTFKVYTATH